MLDYPLTTLLRKKRTVRRFQDMMLIGWQEWCQLPQHHIPAIKAKIDTGAKTSALHAEHIEPFKRLGKHYVRFIIYPIQQNTQIQKICTASVIDQRHVMSSSGHRELRYVIQTPLTVGTETWDIEVTLSNRDPLTFRMLLGREALSGHAVIDPALSLCQGKIYRRTIARAYETPHKK